MPRCGTIGFALGLLPFAEAEQRPNNGTEPYVKSRYTRLEQPMVRDGGDLRPATWDEALDRAADGFARIARAHGARSFGLFSCSKTTNELNFAAQKFARAVIGCNNVDSCNRT